MSPVVERKPVPGEEVGGGGASTGVAQQQPPQLPQDTLATPSLVALPDESPQSDLIPASSAALLPPPPTPSASVVPPPSQDPQVRFAISPPG